MYSLLGFIKKNSKATTCILYFFNRFSSFVYKFIYKNEKTYFTEEHIAFLFYFKHIKI